MRIAQFSTEYPPQIVGGLGRHVEELLRHLAGDCEVHLYLPFESPAVPSGADFVTFQSDVVATESLGLPAQYVEHVFQVGRVLARTCVARAPGAYDVIHCHDWLTGVAGCVLRSLLGRPLVITCHLPQTRPPEALLETLVLERADAIVAVSSFVKEHLVERGLAADKIHVIANGVDATFFHPDAGPRDPHTILFVGRVVPQKGVDALIHSLRYVLTRVPDATLRIVGEGDWLLDSKNLARAGGYPDKVRFFGWQGKEDTRDHYRRAQVAAVPSLFEPFGLTALEAMACGTPVVASNVGGLREVIEDGRNGCLASPGDPRHLAGKICRLLEDRAFWTQVSNESLATARRYSWGATARLVIDLYEELRVRPRPRVNRSRTFDEVFHDLGTLYADRFEQMEARDEGDRLLHPRAGSGGAENPASDEGIRGAD